MDVIDEARTFPTGSHDDYMDTVSQALLWMRNGGYVSHGADTWLDKREKEIYSAVNRKLLNFIKGIHAFSIIRCSLEIASILFNM